MNGYVFIIEKNSLNFKFINKKTEHILKELNINLQNNDLVESISI
jgi:hypothetical protein